MKPARRPLRTGAPCWSFRSVASAVARFLRLLHPLPHFGFDCVEVEARAPLHRRVIEKRLEFLAHQLLHEHESPELILEPIEVLLSPFLVPSLGHPVRSNGSRRRLVM